MDSNSAHPIIRKTFCVLAIVASSLAIYSCYFKDFDPLYTFNYNIENNTASPIHVIGYNAWSGLYEIYLDSTVSNQSVGSLKDFTLQSGQKVLSSWQGYSQVYKPSSDESINELLQGICDSIIFIRYSDSSQTVFKSYHSGENSVKGFFDLNAWIIEKQDQWESVCTFQITNELFDSNEKVAETAKAIQPRNQK